MTMIGKSLKHLKSICVGKLTYLRASYWHQLLSMFDTEGKAKR